MTSEREEKAAITRQRLQLRRNGFHPIPVNGKAPSGVKGWQTKTNSNDSEIAGWVEPGFFPDHLNTGILTADTPAIDIDLDEIDAADAIEQLIRDAFAEHGTVLTRFGREPRRAVLFRTDAPFKKLVLNLIAPNGKTGQKIEIMANGQQLVVNGIHPDTRAPYRWYGGEPGQVKRDALPLLNEADARDMLFRFAELLCKEHGYTLADAPRPARSEGNGATDWGFFLDNLIDHDSDTPFAQSLLRSGMHDGAAVNFMRAAVERLPEDGSGRKQRRLAEIPAMVSSARRKLGAAAVDNVVPMAARRGVDDHLRSIAHTAMVNAAAKAEPPPWHQDPRPDPQAAEATEILKINAEPYLWRDPKTIPLRGWVYGRRYLRENVIETVAPGGAGKSTLIVVEALAMVSGKTLLGVKTPDKLKVWYWNLEEPKVEIERKVQACALQYGLTEDDISCRLFVNSGRDTPLVIAHATREGFVLARPVVEALIAEIARLKIDVIVVDPFVSCHRVPENDNSAQDMVVKEWARIASQTKCAVHLVDHTRKMAPDEQVTTQSSRGGKAKTDACRGVWVVNPMTEQEAEKAGVEHRRFYFRMYDDKPNLHPPMDERAEWYKLVSVDLGNGPPDAYGDSVGVVTKWSWPDMLAGVSGTDFDKAAAAIRSGRWRDSPQAKDWVGHPIAAALELNLEDKFDKAKVKALVKLWIGAGSLVVVEEKDASRRPRNFIRVADDV